jgi:hypothetical protein
MTEPAPAPLPETRPHCRYCGSEMLPGHLAGESVRPATPATVVWTDLGSGMDESLGTVGGFAWSKSPRFPGFQCQRCGAIDLKPLPDEPEQA